MKITQKQLNAARAWLKDFAPINDDYNLSKYKMTSQDLNKIIANARQASGNPYTATLAQVNNQLRGL
jgi:hypothetical protein